MERSQESGIRSQSPVFFLLLKEVCFIEHAILVIVISFHRKGEGFFGGFKGGQLLKDRSVGCTMDFGSVYAT